MNWLLRDGSISVRLLLTLAAPLLVALVLVGMMLAEKYRVHRVSVGVVDAVQIVQPASFVVHELQKERGRTSGFLGSKGKEFGAELKAQRMATDAEVAKLLQTADDTFRRSADPKLRRAVDEARSGIAGLGDVRQAVDGARVDSTGAVERYTTLIGSLMESLNTLRACTTIDAISSKLIALTSLSLAKERAGQERAVGAAGFAAGRFEPELRDRMLRHGEAQDVLLREFQRFANAHEAALFDQLLGSDAMRRVQQMRQAAIMPARSEAAPPTTASAWFAAATERINLLKQIEDAVSADTLTLANSSSDAALRDFAAIGGSLLLVIAVLVVWSFLLAGSIMKPLGAVTKAMAQLSAGSGDVRIPGTERADELGLMARTLVALREAEAKRAEEIRAMDVARAEDLREAEARRTADGHAAESRRTQERRAADEARALEVKDAERRGRQLVNDAIGSALARIAKGDLTARITDDLPSEFAKLKEDFNNAMAELEHTVSAVKENSSSIGVGSSEISTAATDLSRRTENQAAALEETTAALHDITTTIRQTAGNASQARALVESATHSAAQSGEVVRRAVAAMQGIDAASREIGQIIGVIDEIAFQTNLLALNAGVEAARAGDAGRGFAVVASEVRALAQRSADAAKQIKELISTSNVQVEQGVSLVGETGTALERIIGEVHRINKAIAEIADSSQRQANGLQQINTAIGEMDQMTQQNAAMVEETTAATQTLSERTGELVSLVNRFRTAADRLANDDLADAGLRDALRAAAPHVFSNVAQQGHGRRLGRG